MVKNIRYFLTQSKYNIKNAYALTYSFWIGVVSMMLNDIAFFVIWYLFMSATGPINGWTSLDVFGMLGVSMAIFGFANSFFRGLVDLPESVIKGTFDTVLLSPANAFLKISSSTFSVTAYGDLLEGVIVVILYAIIAHFDWLSTLLYIATILFGCIIFVCIRLLCSLTAFFIHDGEVITDQLFELFLRPGLYPGSIFPNKLKIFFMTVIPALLTSTVPIDVVRLHSVSILLFSMLVTAVWIVITISIFRIAIKHYESGNYLR